MGSGAIQVPAEVPCSGALPPVESVETIPTSARLDPLFPISKLISLLL